jgi:hypothetical protein
LSRKIIPEGLNYQVRDVEREITETVTSAHIHNWGVGGGVDYEATGL